MVTCYRDLVQDLKNRGAWFATAGQAILWFRKRRSIVFETNGVEPNTVRIKATARGEDSVPGLRLRIYNPRGPLGVGSHDSEGYRDVAFSESTDNRATCEVGG